MRTLSALYWPQDMDPDARLLLLHGADDERVEVTDSLDLAREWQALGRPFALRVYEGGSHSLIEHRADVRKLIDGWFAP
ncbi:prolyl oligopeptidase family serine peptidase [Altererythrobacter halimionae]|uniref:Prolyl oligopeptidase family serine peptidase n=1 Tax=Alteriqipengyuania halimionae TaxID=1926630 RepID=A0A6I4TZE4_9SPHN|nr:prolyl oligopeptidase family serine peptidase [Alteriqipengyuania halimionae]